MRSECLASSSLSATGMWTPIFASPLTDIVRDEPPRTTMSHDGHSSTQPAVRMHHCYRRGSVSNLCGAILTNMRSHCFCIRYSCQ
ncbi:Netrin-5 [Trichinella spiralis]|uniref:Netrin-5 n=1 Tax=Trichinella spiralis TaxID=6334 RepID=A0ABR3KIV4_TRISP